MIVSLGENKLLHVTVIVMNSNMCVYVAVWCIKLPSEGESWICIKETWWTFDLDAHDVCVWMDKVKYDEIL